MTEIRTPRSTEAATVLLERYAELEGQIAGIEAGRQDSIAGINARADTAVNDLIARRDALREKLQAWWDKHGAELTGGKRKTIELGGCNIGTRSGRTSLAVAGKEDELAKKLAKRPWAKGLIREKVSLNKAAILSALSGAYKRQLRQLGFGCRQGEEQFVLERAEQGGTLAGADA